MEYQVDLASLHPTLMESILCLHCRCHYCGTGDRKKVAFMHAMLSAKTAIAEQHTVLTVKIGKLREDNPDLDASMLIAEWNKEATNDSALNDAKRVGVLILLQYCETEVLDILVRRQTRWVRSMSSSPMMPLPTITSCLDTSPVLTGLGLLG
jgi:hypothetical protein